MANVKRFQELTKERRGEIALAILESDMENKGGVSVGANLRRELGQLSKRTGIPAEELESFHLSMLSRAMHKAYGAQKVEISLVSNEEKT